MLKLKKSGSSLNKPVQMRRGQSGFSLLELMITVAIVAIIGSVAWPFYERQRIKAFRTECINALYTAFNDLERCAAEIGGDYIDRNNVACTINSLAANVDATFRSQSGRCTITLTIDTPSSFNLVAAYSEDLTSSEKIDKDDVCGSLILNNLNVKDISAKGGATVEQCWGQ